MSARQRRATLPRPQVAGPGGEPSWRSAEHKRHFTELLRVGKSARAPRKNEKPSLWCWAVEIAALMPADGETQVQAIITATPALAADFLTTKGALKAPQSGGKTKKTKGARRGGQVMHAPRHPGNTSAVGILVCESLPESPSSIFDRGDLPNEELDVGRVLERALAAGALTWVLETGEQIAGVAIARQRPLTRASHVADLSILVHPLARRRGGGALLLSAMEDAAMRAPDIHKLATRVASDDLALKATLRASSSSWIPERVELEGLNRGGDFVDTELWGLVVGAGPQPIDCQRQ